MAIDISITAGAGCIRYNSSFSVSNTAHAKPRLRNGYLSASASTLERCASLLVLVRAELFLTVAFTLGCAVGITDLATLGGALVSTLGDVLGAAVGLHVGVAFLTTLGVKPTRDRKSVV